MQTWEGVNAARAMLHEPLAVEIVEQDDTAIVRASGACDLSCHEQLREGLLQVEPQAGKRIVVDLSNLRFIDSVGLRVLIGAWNRARQAGCRFLVVVPHSGIVPRIFAISGMDKVLPMTVPQHA